MTESHPLSDIVHSIIERYLARYESASVGIYQFHAIDGGEFSKYLNSLKITLNRKAFITTYCWHYDPYGERYILIRPCRSPVCNQTTLDIPLHVTCRTD